MADLAEANSDEHQSDLGAQSSPKFSSPKTNGRTSLDVDNTDDRRDAKSTSPWWFKWARTTSYIAALGGLCYFVVWFNRNGGAALMQTFLSWVDSVGIWGNFMFAGMFVLISFPFVIGGYTPLTLGAGALYGVVVGTITVSLASVVGASVSFVVCRSTMRGWIERKFRGRDEFDFFMSLFAQSKENRLICILMRLSPIPYGIQNSLFAVTDISYRSFILYTWIGLLPFQILWTQLGSTMSTYTQSNSLTPWQIVSMVLQILIMLMLFIYLWHMMKKHKRAQHKGGAVSVV